MTGNANRAEPARMLVVDDNLMSRKAVAYRLSQAGHDVETAESGEAALEMLGRAPVDLVFLDLAMPGMDGKEVLRRIKGDAALREIPVVIVSGVEDAGAVDECLAAGANDFLHKPVMAGTLADVVADLVGTSEESLAVAAAAGPDPSALAVLDPACIAQLRRDYGDDTASGFVDRFESLSSDQAGAIAAAAEARDVVEWQRTTNGLKGGARTLGLMRLAGVCREIERACGDDRLDDAAAATGRVEGALSEALDALRAHMAGSG